MARGKKAAKTLTPEEKLQQALVPAEEQPYSIPENWCWVHIGDVFDLQAGKNISAKDISDQKNDLNKYPCFGGNGIRGYVNRYSHDGLYPIIGRQGALCGNINLASGKFYATEHAVPVTCKPITDRMWAYYCLTYLNLNQYATATAQPGLAVSNIMDVSIALPPLSEQHRIVDRLESLFAKLDEAKEKAQAVVDGFELWKSAILHKAFSGELTEHWRKERSTDEWFTSTFGQYTNSQYGYTESATQEPIGPKFLRITDIQDGTVDWDKVPYCNISKDDFKKYLIKSGDIIIARTGATTGKSYLIVDNVKAVFASYLIRLTMKQTGLMATYLYYFMQSPSYWQQITEFSAGIAQPGVNAKKLQKIELPIPSVEEQREIVFILDKFLKKEQQAKDAAEAVLDQIDTMKKAILARAFRGELGTNNPAEEWAGEMLKAVL